MDARTIQLTGHPTEEELRVDLQSAVDLFRPAFEEDSPNLLPGNTVRLWRELFGKEINVRAEIIEPALARRDKGYGETPPDYLGDLGE